MSKKLKILFLAIFILSTMLRLALVRFNRESNDDHVLVIQLMLKSDRLPEKPDCPQCYQPKLFHYTVVKIVQAFGLQNRNPDKLAFLGKLPLVAEFVSFIAGLITLLVVAVFLARYPAKHDMLKVLAFGMAALNPKLIGINSQATNDTFAILFSTLALYCTYTFLQKQKIGTFILIILFLALGISSKTNCWNTALAISIALLIKAWLQKDRRAITVGAAFGSILISAVLVALNPLSQYIRNYEGYGAPILINGDRAPLPHFFVKTPVPRPGILSIQDGIFTFKFIELIKHPRIENGDIYPPHRTSLWTQIYGRAYSVHFDNWPESWSTTGDQGFTLSRSIYILSLLPMVMLLVGAVMELFILLKSIIKRDLQSGQNMHYGLTIVVFGGYLAFVILYSVMYRDFSEMKAIFIYPALLAFVVLFMRSGSALYDFLLKQRKWIVHIFEAWIAVLILLYSLDVITLVLLLYSRRLGA